LKISIIPFKEKNLKARKTSLEKKGESGKELGIKPANGTRIHFRVSRRIRFDKMARRSLRSEEGKQIKKVDSRSGQNEKTTMPVPKHASRNGESSKAHGRQRRSKRVENKVHLSTRSTK